MKRKLWNAILFVGLLWSVFAWATQGGLTIEYWYGRELSTPTWKINTLYGDGVYDHRITYLVEDRYAWSHHAWFVKQGNIEYYCNGNREDIAPLGTSHLADLILKSGTLITSTAPRP